MLLALAAALALAAPHEGTYTGKTKAVPSATLLVDSGSVSLAAFTVRCGATTVSTSLNDLPIKKRKVDITLYGSLEFADGRAPENGPVTVHGRFGRRATGIVAVRSSTCSTGRQKWVAKRRAKE